MGKLRYVIVSVVAVSVMVAIVPVQASEIAFVREQSNGDKSLRTVNPSTGAARFVTRLDNGDDCYGTSCDDHDPAWSHSRSRIAFVHQLLVWTISASGNDRRALTHDAFESTNPSWSPGDKKLALDSYDPIDEEGSVVILQVDGRGGRELDGDDPPEWDGEWSPTRDHLVASRRRYERRCLHLVRYSGTSNEQKVIGPCIEDARGKRRVRSRFSPSWSPSGNSLAHVAGHASYNSITTGNEEIWRVHRSGDKLRRLTNTANDVDDDDPAWSPNGDWIAFVKRRDGERHIWRMRPDGSDKEKLTHVGSANQEPAWSPDSTQIAFVSNRDGDGEIYVMNLATRSVRQLTRNSVRDDEPAWAAGTASGSN